MLDAARRPLRLAVIALVATAAALPAAAHAAPLPAPTGLTLPGNGEVADPSPTPRLNYPLEPVALSWARVEGASGYEVQLSENEQFSAIVVTQVTSATALVPKVDTGLAIGSAKQPKTYFWRVRALTGDASSDDASKRVAGEWSDRGRFERVWDAQPRNLQNGDQNFNMQLADRLMPLQKWTFGPIFSWDPVAGAERYEIEVATSPEFADHAILYHDDGVYGPSLGLPMTFLDAKEYSWRVRAIDQKGRKGEWSSIARFQKDYGLMPQNAKVDLARMQFSWDPVENASAYLVALTDVTTGSPVVFTKVRTNSYTPGTCDLGPGAKTCAKIDDPFFDLTIDKGFPGLGTPRPVTAGHAYAWSVTPVDEPYTGTNQLGGIIGQSTPTMQFIAPPEAPADPALTPVIDASTMNAVPGHPVSGGAIQNNTLTPGFSWAPVPGASGYALEVALDPNFRSIVQIGYTAYASWTPSFAGVHGGTLADVDGIEGSYFWRVRASGGGWSVGRVRKDDPVRNVRVVPLGERNRFGQFRFAPHIAWDPTDAAAKYEVQVSRSSRFDSDDVKAIVTDSLHTGFRDPLPDGDFYYRVRAIDGADKKLAWSTSQLVDPVTAATLEPPNFKKHLDRPRLRSFSGTDGQVGETAASPLLLWSAVPNAEGYRIEIDRDPRFPSPKPFETEDNAFVPDATDIERDVAYFWRVAAVQTSRPGGFSDDLDDNSDTPGQPGRFFLASGPVIELKPSAGRLPLGRVATLTGGLRVNGAARAGAALVAERSEDGGTTWKTYARVTTGAGGLFTFDGRVSRSYKYRIVWAGAGIFGRSTSREVTVAATPRLQLAKLPKHIMARHNVLLSGRLQAGRRGEKVQLQYLTPKGYRPLADVSVDRKGRFALPWQPRLSGRYILRAVAGRTVLHANVASPRRVLRVDDLFIVSRRTRGPS